MKRRVMVALALVHRPPVIVLDEPTAGVDVELRQNLWQFITRLNTDGHTIILTTHYLEEAQSLCNRIAMLKHGEIVALDSTRNLLDTETELQLALTTDQTLPDNLRHYLIKEDDNNHYLLKLADYNQLTALLQILQTQRINVINLNILENVFLRLTSDHVKGTK